LPINQPILSTVIATLMQVGFIIGFLTFVRLVGNLLIGIRKSLILLIIFSFLIAILMS